MKRLIGVLAIVLLSSCQQHKIGYVDYAELMDGYQRKIDLESNYQSKADGFARRRDSISQVFQLEAQQLQNQTRGMSQQKAQEEFAALQQRGQMIGQQLQLEEQGIQAEGQQRMDSLFTEVKERIGAYGKANGYTYILASGEGGSVLYGDEAQDVTEAVLKLLNDEYKK